MSKSSSRHFLKSSVIGVAATASASQSFAQSPDLPKNTIAQVRALQVREIQATTAA